MPVKRILTKEEIEIAQKRTKSNFAAARYLNCSYPHYKKYAKLYKNEEGVSLLEAHKNQSGKGIPKFLNNTSKEPALFDLIEGRVSVESFDPQKIKRKLITEGLIEEKCYQCGFSERRVTDTKVPLILNHKNGNKKDYKLDNLEFLCYNCSFLYAAAPIEEKEIEILEGYQQKKSEVTWELDEHHVEHLKELGLYDEENPGEEYISRL